MKTNSNNFKNTQKIEILGKQGVYRNFRKTEKTEKPYTFFGGFLGGNIKKQKIIYEVEPLEAAPLFCFPKISKISNFSKISKISKISNFSTIEKQKLFLVLQVVKNEK